MSFDARRNEGEPFDRLTRLCAEMTAVLDEKGDQVDDVKCIVFLNDDSKGGLQMWGYDDDTEAIADLFIHLKVMFEANGKQLMFAPLPGRG